jgi:hypothetical protein
MAQSYLLPHQLNDWLGPEPQPKDVHLREKAVKSFPSEKLDFEQWMATVATSLDENGLKHHLDMNDDIEAGGLTDKEKSAMVHLDATELPCGKDGVNKYSIKLKMARKQNRIKIFAYIQGKCTPESDAVYIAEEIAVYGKPRTLLLRIQAHYSVIDANDVDKWEDQFNTFKMTHLEPIDDVKRRLEGILRELKKLKYDVPDNVKRKQFLDALKGAEWDIEVKAEKRKFPPRDPKTKRTFHETYMHLRSDEKTRIARSENRPPKAIGQDKVYSVSQIPDNQKVKLMHALMKQQEVKAQTATNAPAGGTPAGQQSKAAARKAAYAAKMKGRKPKNQKYTNPP